MLSTTRHAAASIARARPVCAHSLQHASQPSFIIALHFHSAARSAFRAHRTASLALAHQPPSARRHFATQSDHDEKKSQQQQQQQEGKDPYADEGANDTSMPRSRRSVIIRRILLGSSAVLVLGLTIHFNRKGALMHLDEIDRPWYSPLTDAYDGLTESLKTSLGISDRPLLPPPSLDQFGRKPRTLVLGVEDVLAHLEWDRYTSYELKHRPHLDEFLEAAFRLGYEIVLFSKKSQYEVEPLLASIDKSGFARHRLFYEQMNFKNFRPMKDLERLNREYSRVLVVDFNDALYEGHENNVLQVPQWRNDNDEDIELRRIIPILEKIQRYNIYDVRAIVEKRKANNGDNRGLFDDEEKIERMSREKLEQRKSKRGKRSLRGSTSASSSSEADSESPNEPSQSWASWLRSKVGL